MMETEATIRQSYKDLRGLNLGTGFVKDAQLEPGTKYTMTIAGLDGVEVEGTLDKSGFIGGLAKLYREYDLQIEDPVIIEFDGAILHVTPPPARRNPAIQEAGAAGTNVTDTQPTVAGRQGFRHIHIEPYSAGNLRNWTPRTEPDVYMVFGAISEYTDYRYCCGTNQELLKRLGYNAVTKPDAILIDRGTDQYLVAEFKMKSSEFCSNHHADDVDVLVCWEDDEPDRAKLPPTVLGLRDLLERAVRDGDIDL